MEFKKGKKVKLKSKHYNTVCDGTILTMNSIGTNRFCFFSLEYPEEYIYFPDCEEIETKPETKPHRYKSREVNGMDVIDLVKHWDLNFNEGNVLKYLLRDKGQDIEDLEKIIDYAQRELKHRQNEV